MPASWCSISSYSGRNRSISTLPPSRRAPSGDEAGSVRFVGDAGGVERRHLAEDARARLEHGQRQAGAGALAETELQVEHGLQVEGIEDRSEERRVGKGSRA